MDDEVRRAPGGRSPDTYHARLVKVKNVSAEVSERQALSNLMRCSRSRDSIIKYDSLSTLMSRADVGARRAGLEHCRNIPLLPVISGWERAEKRLARLLSCVGMSKVLEWFLLFLATMASSHAEDRRLAKDGGEMRIQIAYAYYARWEAPARWGSALTGRCWPCPWSRSLRSSSRIARIRNSRLSCSALSSSE